MFVTWTKNTISRADSISFFLPPDQPRVLLYLFVSPGGFFPVLPSFRMVTDDRARKEGESKWDFLVVLHSFSWKKLSFSNALSFLF